MANKISSASMAEIEEARAAYKAYNDHLDSLEKNKLQNNVKSLPTVAENIANSGKAALDSFSNEATLGYLPQIQAAASKLIPDPNAELDRELTKQGFKIKNAEDPSYVQLRDEYIAKLAQQKKDYPIGSMAGSGAGILASIAGTGAIGGVAKGASTAKKLASAVGAGAAISGLTNPGDVEGELSPLQLEQRKKNAALGAALGAGGMVLAEGAGMAANKASEALKNYAGKKAFRALGLGAAKKTEELAKSGKDIEIGKQLLESKSIPVLGSTSRIAKNVDALQEEAGQSIGEILKKAGKGDQIFDSEAVAIKLLDHPDIALLRKTPGMEGTVKTIENAAETLANNGKLSLEQANELKRAIDRSINYNKKIPEMMGKQEGLFKARTAVRDEMNDLVNKMSEGQTKDQLLIANRKSGNLATASEILDKELGREQRNRMVGLTDTIAAGSGLYMGDTPAEKAIYGLLLGALNKGGRKFGNTIQARSADALANQLSKIPNLSKIAENNPAEFSAALSKIAENVGFTSTPKKGEQAWIMNGADKLGLRDDQELSNILSTKKGKNLLLMASDLPKNSKKLEIIKNELLKVRE